LTSPDDQEFEAIDDGRFSVPVLTEQTETLTAKLEVGPDRSTAEAFERCLLELHVLCLILAVMASSTTCP